MARQTPRRWKRHLGVLAGGAFAIGVCANALAAKPISTVFSEVAITFGGQVYGFSGAQESFAQSENGGRIVFDLTTLGSPGDIPVTEIDVNGLDPGGNHWDVVLRVGHRDYTFTGTCASETFSSMEGGMSVRHLYLTCATLTSSATP
jgi:hypothetical protein